MSLDHINTILTDDDAKYVLSVKDSVYLQRTKDTRTLALETYTAASQAGNDGTRRVKRHF